ncbi:MAG: ribose 5-phosphate isomerase A [Longimicrobiales bacterium]
MTVTGKARAKELKRAAGFEAAGRVESGMKLGLGTGSTVAHFLTRLGQRLKAGELADVVGVPTSERTEKASLQLGIPLGSLSELGSLDLTVDGADEVTPSLDLIKGLGGALLREKMVARASRQLVIVADEGKCVDRLGTLAPLPVEVVQFEYRAQVGWLKALGCSVALRPGTEGEPYETDNGNFILDCRFADGIEDPAALEDKLNARAGVVESGLFLELATEAIIAGDNGIRCVRRDGSW